MRNAIPRKTHAWDAEADQRLLEAVDVYGTESWLLGPPHPSRPHPLSTERLPLLVTPPGDPHAYVRPRPAEYLDGTLQLRVFVCGPGAPPEGWLERARVARLALCGGGVLGYLAGD